MTCPTLERLQAVVVDGERDPDLEAHVESCAECRALATVMEDVALAFDPGIKVPPELIAQTVARVHQPGGATQVDGVPWVSVFVAGGLGWATALVWLVLSGVAGPGEPHRLVLFTLLVGLATMLGRYFLGFGGVDTGTRGPEPRPA
jgi:hypothetical protein